MEASQRQELAKLQEEIQILRANNQLVQQPKIQIPPVQNDLNQLLEEEKNDAVISIPGSQESHYHFGVGSVGYPEGYRFKIPNPNEFLGEDYLYRQICGEGHFERSDGRTMNVVQMIGECFKESKQLREQLKESSADNNKIADFANGLQSQINDLRTMTENSVQELQKAIVRNKKDIVCQVNELNIDITKNLATANQLQSTTAKVDQKCSQLEQDLQKGLLEIKLQPAEENTEYFDKRIQQLQEQISILASSQPAQSLNDQPQPESLAKPKRSDASRANRRSSASKQFIV